MFQIVRKKKFKKLPYGEDLQRKKTYEKIKIFLENHTKRENKRNTKGLIGEDKKQKKGRLTGSTTSEGLKIKRPWKRSICNLQTQKKVGKETTESWLMRGT